MTRRPPARVGTVQQPAGPSRATASIAVWRRRERGYARRKSGHANQAVDSDPPIVTSWDIIHRYFGDGNASSVSRRLITVTFPTSSSRLKRLRHPVLTDDFLYLPAMMVFLPISPKAVTG